MSLERVTLAINLKKEKKENVKNICTCKSLVKLLFNVTLIATEFWVKNKVN